MTKQMSKPAGRPRRFDPEKAIAIAQQLFHEHGYDAVGVADITRALGIKPPSFYAAFGSKAELYSRVLDRYACTGAIPLQDFLRADTPVAEGLAALLEEAARRYAADPLATGCLVLESTRSNDQGVREAAGVFHINAEEEVRAFIAARHPEDAERLADFVSTAMSGLSARARNGQSLERLLASARLAGDALRQALPG
ncbi:TetR/AcrR family transcriptional regulator [Rhodobacterales bacterium]|nr:TetR/AcrR family transcriptional regulator [Rhodobacterales bacterium]